MKNKNILKLFIFFIIFAGCEDKWDMEISFDDDFSGSYSIAVLIAQEAQMYAVETGQSAIGGLDRERIPPAECTAISMEPFSA